MAISVPLNLGFAASASTPTTLAITTGNAVAAGDAIVVWHYANATNSTATSVTDSSSNTYHLLISSGAVAPLLEVYVVYNAASMASSSTITIPSFTNTSLRHGMCAYTITGLMNNNAGIPLDPHTIGTQNIVKGSSAVTSTSIPIGNSYSNIQILLGIMVAGTSPGTFTAGGSFTQLGGGTTNAWMFPCYQIISAVTGVTFAPSWVTGQTFGAYAFAMPGKPASNTSRQAQMSLCGVGA